jgi:plasmid stability protein
MDDNGTEKPANLNIRDIPRESLFRLKMAAAAEHRSLKDLVLELIEAKIQELEKKGLLPKRK